MYDPYFEPLLALWEDSDNEQSDPDNDDGSGDSLDQWQAYMPDTD